MTPQAKMLLQSLLAKVSWEMHNGMNLREHCDDRRENYTDEQLEDAYDELKNVLYDMTLEDQEYGLWDTESGKKLAKGTIEGLMEKIGQNYRWQISCPGHSDEHLQGWPRKETDLESSPYVIAKED